MSDVNLRSIPFRCATIYSTGSKKSVHKNELCPDCKVYLSDLDPLDEIGDGKTLSLGHDCPSCQDSLVSFLKSGKWIHKCEKCETSSYYCDMSELFQKNEHLINNEI
jgi:Zn-finger nucleic acid-binding protein